jgi:hypothetical protein
MTSGTMPSTAARLINIQGTFLSDRTCLGIRTCPARTFRPRSKETIRMAVLGPRVTQQDLVEHYFEQPWSDGLPVVPPTPARVAAVIEALGGDAQRLEARIPPRWGSLTSELLAVNMVMAGCEPAYAPVVRAAVLALCDPRFNLNGIQATTHVAAPLLVVNGPIAREIGMNSGGNVFGSGNRANATIGRALRLILLSVGGGIPGEPDKSTLGHPGKYTFCIAENEASSPWAPYHVEHGYQPGDSTVFVIAAEAPHSVTNHVAYDPQGILDSVASAMSTIAHNNAVLAGSCAVVVGPEHARTIAGHGWTRDDVRRYLWTAATNPWEELSFGDRYAPLERTTYNRNCRDRDHGVRARGAAAAGGPRHGRPFSAPRRRHRRCSPSGPDRDGAIREVERPKATTPERGVRHNGRRDRFRDLPSVGRRETHAPPRRPARQRAAPTDGSVTGVPGALDRSIDRVPSPASPACSSSALTR